MSKLRVVAGAWVVVVVLAVAAVGAQAATKGGDSFIGQHSPVTGTAADGGLFNAPRDIAVDQDTGQVYVVDSAIHRIQRLDADGDFELAWGRNVSETTTTGDDSTAPGYAFEICTAAGDCQGDTGGEDVGGFAGTLGGMFDDPQGIAVDTDTGDVYVTDRDNRRIQHFSFDDQGTSDPSDDTPVFERAWGHDVTAGGAANFEICTAAADCQAGDPGDAPGQFGGGSATPRVDISKDGDPGAGEVVVGDPSNRRVQLFELANPAASTAFGDAGMFGGSNSSPAHVAIDPAGMVYAADTSDATVERYDVDTAALHPDGPILHATIRDLYPGPDVSAGIAVRALEVDPTTGRLLVVADPGNDGTPGSATADTVIYEIADAHSASLSLTHVHMRGGGPETLWGLGTLNSPVGAAVYATGSGGVIGHRVLVLDEDGAGPMGLTVEAPSEVGAHEVTLGGSVDPNGPTGFPADYRFEYSKDGIDWTPVTEGATALADPDGGEQPVSAAVEGLEANTPYRVRLVAFRDFAHDIRFVSPELTFVTEAPAPAVQTLEAPARTARSARLLGRLNPEGSPTEWHFEYLTEERFGEAGWQAAESVPVPGAEATGTSARLVHVDVAGLEPGTAYRYRLVATNGRPIDPECDTATDECDVIVEGEARAFTTRAAVDAPSAERAYEMVTSPEKVNRRGEDGRGEGVLNVPDLFAVPGMPARDGESVLFGAFGTILDPEAGTGAAHMTGWELLSRGEAGWDGEAVNNVPFIGTGTQPVNLLTGLSADLKTSAWWLQVPIFPSTRDAGTRAIGDDGGFEGSGWYEWPADGDDALGLLGDDSRFMLRWSDAQGLMGADDPSHPDFPDAGAGHPAGALTQVAGAAPYLTGPAADWQPAELVSTCTAGTEIPLRDDQGTRFLDSFDGGALADDTIAAQPCTEGSVASTRGAIPGHPASAVTAMSEDGRRIFLSSPDPGTAVEDDLSDLAGLPGRDGRARCAVLSGDVETSDFVEHVGADTECPAQLFVRQYDASGDPSLRWVSRSEVEDQNADSLFRPAFFEGASTDGRYVFFRTSQPLLESDPNAGSDVRTGSAQEDSWDLYRYELPASLDEDPTGPGAGGLLRVTGGPSGTEDPNTNAGEGDGAGSAARYISDDGKRVYFVTRGTIAGADNDIPAGGVTAAGGGVSQNDTRNLYFYDADADRYKFVARLPFAASSVVASAAAIDACATSYVAAGPTRGGTGSITRSNCLRGTTSGDAVVFESAARLTGDDVDDAADVYLYDAGADELVRLSTPLDGQTPYHCAEDTTGTLLTDIVCNGELGWALPDTGSHVPIGGVSGLRQHNLAENPDGSLRAVYFQSRHRLIADDDNGAYWDVYEWRDGELRLISPGSTADHAFYSGNSLDGEDVFFHTSQRIDPREIDPSDGDLYDARIGGGFPPPPPPPAVCTVLADACQGAGGSPVGIAPVTQRGGAAQPGGGANAAPGPRARLRVVRPGRRARRRAVRTGVIRVRVRTNVPGRVAVVAKARMSVGRGRARRVVARTIARRRLAVRKPGVRVVRMRLNRVAVRRLRAGRAVRIRVRVNRPDARAQRVGFVLRRAAR